MTHQEITDAVRASELLAPSTATRHDVYPNRPTSRRVNRCVADDAPLGSRVSARSSSGNPRHAARDTEAGHDGRPGQPTHCASCGRRWGALVTDRYATGESSWTGDLCPSCAWDSCPIREGAPNAAAAHMARLMAAPDDPRIAEREFPPLEPRVIPGTRRVM